MKRIANYFSNLARNLKITVYRFPVILFALAFICAVDFILIENNYTNQQLLIRLLFAGIFAAFLNLAVQFVCERFKITAHFKWLLHAAALPASVLYFYFMTSRMLGAVMSIRLFVCCFALLAFVLYLPSLKKAADFNKIFLVHFKSVFTALLYGVILFLGLSAIYGAINLLLVELKNTVPLHLANIVFVFFTPVYYLSLLPDFNSTDEKEAEKNGSSSVYPRFLEILVSYIAIPLISVYTVVLAAYFIKILITLNWPVGQICPMILIYSAAGFFIYVLCGPLENRFSVLFRRYFPFTEIILVLLQLVSVVIRIQAYGITESRYYVALFGIFSVVCSLYLLLSKLKKPGLIALLAACFAVFSIIPPADAFNVSRVSQTKRVEEILMRNGMLSGNTLTPKSVVSNDDKSEITSIIFYMENMGHLNNIEWIPAKYRMDGINEDFYGDFSRIFGFPPYYGNNDIDYTYINVFLNNTNAVDITDFDVLLRIDFNGGLPNGKTDSTTFELNDKKYFIQQNISQDGGITIAVSDETSGGAAEVFLNELLNQIASNYSGKAELPPDQMTAETENDQLRVRIVIENANMELSSSGEPDNINGTAYVLIAHK